MLGAKVFRLSPNEIVSPIIAAHSFIWSQEIQFYTFSFPFFSLGCFLDIWQRNRFACLNCSWGLLFIFLLQSYKVINHAISDKPKLLNRRTFVSYFECPFFLKQGHQKVFIQSFARASAWWQAFSKFVVEKTWK